jgi:hypothetical protein
MAFKYVNFEFHKKISSKIFCEGLQIYFYREHICELIKNAKNEENTTEFFSIVPLCSLIFFQETDVESL